ncbi:NAD(P)H-binding protein [Streptomyces spinosisporus]|uniref:NAD(P)H-binding protein n=1 Tax=Streptomyces spinosisporus TaxID=2927582 RepID=A0ABS9XJ15_9ACTN|nr:NAD(P)H-binding protein [Streptomyces spinosisporus]MCI3242064.1 NAD(P)H-binding protein [Streptomyces spinosisporus]
MIVLTTPTGQIGRRTLDRLLAADAPVRVIVRDASRLPAAVRDRVQIVEGSHGDPDVIAKAFAGADTLFWLVPPIPQAPSVDDAYAGFSRPALDALRTHGVERVVSVSALGRGTPQAEHAGPVTASLALDDLLAATGVHHRALVMPSFMENLLRQTELIRSRGMFTSPVSGDRKMPTCAIDDIAAVAADLLLDDGWTGVEEVPVLGPEDLSFAEMAEIMSEVLERPVRFQQVPGADFRDRLLQFGSSEAMAQGMLDMMLAKDAGLDNAVTRTDRSSTPTSFRRWCEDVLKPAVLG